MQVNNRIVEERKGLQLVENKRLKWIDNAKGIAMLLVITGHVSGELEGIWNFDFVGGIHLVMFFLIAGYTMRKKKITSDFLNQKFARLMIPYFITCGAVLIMDIFNSYLMHDNTIETITAIINVDLVRSFFASGAITNFVVLDIGRPIGAIWFLPAMFFCNIIFQFVLNYFEDNDTISGLISIGIAVTGMISARFIWLPFSIQSGMFATAFVWIGYMIKKKQVLLKVKWYHYLMAQIILMAGIWRGYCNNAFVIASSNDWILSVVVGLSGCLLIYLCAVLYQGKVLEYIGKNSLLVMCTHLFALETMGNHFYQLLDSLSLQGNARVWGVIIIEILFAVLAAFAIERIRSHRRSRKETVSGTGRDMTVDILKGIFIIEMLIGHFTIHAGLRAIIYSCHMVAFVFLSGYFYNSSRKFSDSLKKMVKSFLGPYLVFVVCALLLNRNQWSIPWLKGELIKYFLGFSFAKNVLPGMASVGPVYFVLLLFAVRLLYMVIDKTVPNEFWKWSVTLLVSVFGVHLGQCGCWLPWSFDVALYCVIFYKLGLFFRQKKIVEYVKNHYPVYFLLSPVWAYMIYAGGMEIAIRNYGQYGLVVIGSVTGILTIWIFADYIAGHTLGVRAILNELGKDSIYLIIIHTLLNGWICDRVSLRFHPEHFTCMILVILIQSLMAVGIRYAISFARILDIPVLKE